MASPYCSLGSIGSRPCAGESRLVSGAPPSWDEDEDSFVGAETSVGRLSRIVSNQTRLCSKKSEKRSSSGAGIKASEGFLVVASRFFLRRGSAAVSCPSKSELRVASTG